MSKHSGNANVEFHDIHGYFSEDSEDLVLRRRQSSIPLAQEGMSQNTPMLPLVLAQELEEKEIKARLQKHDVHQKVRW